MAEINYCLGVEMTLTIDHRLILGPEDGLSFFYLKHRIISFCLTWDGRNPKTCISSLSNGMKTKTLHWCGTQLWPTKRGKLMLYAK